jgi:hypothetical protein
MPGATRYRCECGWEGTEAEMLGASCSYDDENCEWSDWICPSCHTWWQLEDYLELPAEASPGEGDRPHRPGQ